MLDVDSRRGIIAMDMRQFYQVRIAECAADAAKADVPRLRERALRSQQSWQALLDRIERHNAAPK